MIKKPLVSVVIINWNGIQFIDKCLKSIISSTYNNLEIIVVDNNSSDGSPEYISKNYPNVKVIKNNRNLGFAAACNIGIKNTRGDIVVVANNDIWVDSSWLDPLIELASKPEIGIVGPVVLEPRDSSIQNAGYRLHVSCYPIAIFQGRKYQSEELPSLITVDYVSGAAMVARKDLLVKLGKFDERFFAFYEDADICLRVKKLGYRCYICTTSRIYHFGSASWNKFGLWQFLTSELSRIIFIIKHYGILHLVKSLLVYDIQYWIKRIIDVKHGLTKTQRSSGPSSLLKTILNVASSRFVILFCLPKLLITFKRNY